MEWKPFSGISILTIVLIWIALLATVISMIGLTVYIVARALGIGG